MNSGHPVQAERAPSTSTLIAFAPLAVIVIVGATLRITELQESLAADELWTYVGATQSGLDEAIDYVRSDQEITPPLYTVLAWLSAKLGDATVLIRLPPLLGGILTIPLIYALGLRTLRSHRVAALAAILAALNSFLIWQSVEARAYGLAIALVVASTLSLLLAIDTGRKRWWVAYAAFSCAAMYTHYTSAFVLFAQLAWALWFHREFWREAAVANLVAAVGFLPWLPGLAEDVESPTKDVYELLAPFGLENFVDFTARFAVGHSGVGLHAFLGTWAEAALICGIALAIGGASYAWLAAPAGARPPRARSEALALLVMLAIAAPVGAAASSLIGQDLYLPRNLAVSWPALAVVMAALLLGGPLIIRVVATALVVGAFSYGAILTVAEPELQRPALRDAAALIDESTGPTDVVLDVNPIFVGGIEGAPLSPPALTLDVHLTEPHTNIHYLTPPDGRRALREAAGHRLALAGDPLWVGGARDVLGLSDETPLVERSYEGLLPTIVEVFAIPGDDRSRTRGNS
jgi:Dolichyl-phosphate-mannose-protein mannosyltransferase